MLLVVALVAAAVLIWPWRGDPEGRAREFIEVLIFAPQDTEALRRSAGVPESRDPRGLIGSLSAQVALDFLRAKHAQGATLLLETGVRQAEKQRRSITVYVSETNTRRVARGEARFLVSLERDESGNWRITGVGLQE
jgi:hypothetical protein